MWKFLQYPVAGTFRRKGTSRLDVVKLFVGYVSRAVAIRQQTQIVSLAAQIGNDVSMAPDTSQRTMAAVIAIFVPLNENVSKIERESV